MAWNGKTEDEEEVLFLVYFWMTILCVCSKILCFQLSQIQGAPD